MSGVERSVADQAASATSTTSGTFIARVEGWRELLGQWSSSGPVGLAIGQPYGSGFERYQGGFFGGTAVTYAPHNYFVATLLREGLIGLAALVWLLWGLLSVGFTRSESSERFGPPLVGAIAASVILYSIPYRPTTDSGLLLGATLCYAYAMRRASTRDADLASDEAQTDEAQAGDDHRPAVSRLLAVQRGKLS